MRFFGGGVSRASDGERSRAPFLERGDVLDGIVAESGYVARLLCFARGVVFARDDARRPFVGGIAGRDGRGCGRRGAVEEGNGAGTVNENERKGRMRRRER